MIPPDGEVFYYSGCIGNPGPGKDDMIVVICFLGYCRPRKISYSDTKLLQRSTRGYSRQVIKELTMDLTPRM